MRRGKEEERAREREAGESWREGGESLKEKRERVRGRRRRGVRGRERRGMERDDTAYYYPLNHTFFLGIAEKQLHYVLKPQKMADVM